MISATKLPQIQSPLSPQRPAVPSLAGNRQPGIERNSLPNSAQMAAQTPSSSPFNLKNMLQPLLDIFSSAMSMIGQAFSVAKNLTGFLS